MFGRPLRACSGHSLGEGRCGTPLHQARGSPHDSDPPGFNGAMIEVSLYVIGQLRNGVVALRGLFLKRFQDDRGHVN